MLALESRGTNSPSLISRDNGERSADTTPARHTLPLSEMALRLHSQYEYVQFIIPRSLTWGNIMPPVLTDDIVQAGLNDCLIWNYKQIATLSPDESKFFYFGARKLIDAIQSPRSPGEGGELAQTARERAKARFRMLKHLPENHDGEGASAPIASSVDDAIAFVDDVVGAPRMLPTLDDDGSAVIEFEDKSMGVFCDITFLPDHVVEVFCKNKLGTFSFTGPYTTRSFREFVSDHGGIYLRQK